MKGWVKRRRTGFFKLTILKYDDVVIGRFIFFVNFFNVGCTCMSLGKRCIIFWVIKKYLREVPGVRGQIFFSDKPNINISKLKRCIGSIKNLRFFLFQQESRFSTNFMSCWYLLLILKCWYVLEICITFTHLGKLWLKVYNSYSNGCLLAFFQFHNYWLWTDIYSRGIRVSSATSINLMLNV